MKTSTRSTPTIKDIALACGVSPATVSYVVNGKGGMSPETHERVMRAIAEMNYHPSAVARGLQKKRVQTLGVLFGQIDPSHCLQDPYMAGVMAGIMGRAQLDGFAVLLITQLWENGAQSALPLRDGRTDGIIALAPPLDSGMLEGLGELGVPIVAIAGPQKEGVPVVDIDNYTGARLATEHLIGLGHQRIAYLSGYNNISCYAPRRAGYCDALIDAGLEVDLDLIQISSFIPSISCEKLRAMLASPTPPTAVFAGNDAAAMGAIEAAHSFGLKVPEQFSVVGFDDIPTASLLSPPLTTVRQPLKTIGETATALLIEQICSATPSKPSEPILLAPELIVRGSTASRHKSSHHTAPITMASSPTAANAWHLANQNPF